MNARILVVDDEPDFVELISFRLKAAGYEVFSAHNGLDGLLKARRFLPDLVVLDVMMDGTDGYSVCEIMRCQPSTKTVPIIMVTAASGQIARMNGLAAGANEFLTKPFSPSELMTKVDQVLKECEERNRREKAQDQAEATIQKVLGRCQ